MAESKSVDVECSTVYEEPPHIFFFLTGFGKFLGIKDNPTTHLMTHIRDYLNHSSPSGSRIPSNATLVGTDVIHVSAWGVNNYFKTIPDRLNAALREYEEERKKKSSNANTTTLGVSTDDANAKTTPPHHVVFLHFGVAAGTSCTRLEEWGYNHTNIPDDEAHERLINTRVLDWNPSLCLRTYLPVKYLWERIRGKGLRINISSDPGRYVCNYMYFSSLDFTYTMSAKSVPHGLTPSPCDHSTAPTAETTSTSSVTANSVAVTFSEGERPASTHQSKEPCLCVTYHSLFTHVPEFTEQSIDDQLEIVASLIEEVTAYISKYAKNYCRSKISAVTAAGRLLTTTSGVRNYTFDADYVPNLTEATDVAVTPALMALTHSTQDL